jgi:hypothetical protein
MYYENHISRGTLLKRRSTRHVSEVTAIASKFGNSAKIIVPRSWRVIAFLHSEFNSLYAEEGIKDLKRKGINQETRNLGEALKE